MTTMAIMVRIEDQEKDEKENDGSEDKSLEGESNFQPCMFSRQPMFRQILRPIYSFSTFILPNIKQDHQ